MEKCQRLRQYSELVAIVRDYLEKGMDKEEAMRKGVGRRHEERLANRYFKQKRYGGNCNVTKRV